MPHTPWRLLEHMRLAQWVILGFCRNPIHVSPNFPDGYWPRGDAPPDADAWDRSAGAFRADLRAMQDMVADASSDLFAPIPPGQGRNPNWVRDVDNQTNKLGYASMPRHAKETGIQPVRLRGSR